MYTVDIDTGGTMTDGLVADGAQPRRDQGRHHPARLHRVVPPGPGRGGPAARLRRRPLRVLGPGVGHPVVVDDHLERHRRRQGGQARAAGPARGTARPLRSGPLAGRGHARGRARPYRTARGCRRAGRPRPGAAAVRRRRAPHLRDPRRASPTRPGAAGHEARRGPVSRPLPRRGPGPDGQRDGPGPRRRDPRPRFGDQRLRPQPARLLAVPGRGHAQVRRGLERPAARRPHQRRRGPGRQDQGGRHHRVRAGVRHLCRRLYLPGATPSPVVCLDVGGTTAKASVVQAASRSTPATATSSASRCGPRWPCCAQRCSAVAASPGPKAAASGSAPTAWAPPRARPAMAWAATRPPSPTPSSSWATSTRVFLDGRRTLDVGRPARYSSKGSRTRSAPRSPRSPADRRRRLRDRRRPGRVDAGQGGGRARAGRAVRLRRQRRAVRRTGRRATGIDTAHVFALSPVLSAFGSSVSDVVHVYERTLGVRASDSEAVDAAVAALTETARRDLAGEGFDPDSAEIEVEQDTSQRDGRVDVVRVRARQRLEPSTRHRERPAGRGRRHPPAPCCCPTVAASTHRSTTGSRWRPAPASRGRRWRPAGA